MATLDYHKIGKGIEINGSTFYTFYGKDFNPNVPSIPSWTTIGVSQETSSFNLTGFQPGNEVGCLVLVLNHGGTTGTRYIEAEFQAYVGGWQTQWSSTYNYSVTSGQKYMAYIYFGVDDDEIRDYSNQYKIVINREYSDGTGDNGVETSFTVSSLSIDSDTHGSGYLWVEGEHLCYIDGVHGSTGYKHKIQRDSYNGGSGTPGYMRIPSSSTDQRIYYVDAYGTVRRTHVASDRYSPTGTPNTGYVGSSYAGNIRVSDGDFYDGYGYLCYVDGGGYKRRMGNGEP